MGVEIEHVEFGSPILAPEIAASRMRDLNRRRRSARPIVLLGIKFDREDREVQLHDLDCAKKHYRRLSNRVGCIVCVSTVGAALLPLGGTRGLLSRARLLPSPVSACQGPTTPTTPKITQPQISIVGAGLSGLVLGRCLLQRGITSVLFEREAIRTGSGSGSTRHGYGITLHPWAYRPLLKYLNTDESTFREKLAVDAGVGGDGRIDTHIHPVIEAADASSFRANRSKLETMLREGLDIRWEHGLADVRNEGELNTLEFRGGQQIQSKVVIGADGPHSQVRKSISPTTEFNVLPYAVYNGKRRMTREVFDEKYAPFMDGANVIERKDGNTLMQITVNDRNATNASISYTYSRPAEKSDPLFNPDRPVSGATDIPHALFDEISELKNLEGPFKDVFDVDSMQNDRLLNWLMRSVFVKGPELREAAERGVVVIGDSVHAGPILGGYGANAAVKDGIEMAEQIINHGTKGLAEFYEPRYETWRKYVDMSERQLAEMHGKTQPNL